MTLIRNNIGSLKTLNITPFVVEQNITPTAPPSAMSTGSPQYSVTFNKSVMSPFFSGNAQVQSYRPTFGMNLAGQNTSGATVTIYWQINKNGASYKSGNSSITNNYYFNLSLGESPNDGDVYDFYLWTSASSGVTFSYSNYWCLAGRVDTGAKYLYNYTVNVPSNLSVPTYFPIAGSKIGSAWGGYVGIYPTNGNNNLGLTTSATAINVIPFMAVHPTYKLFSNQLGDSSTFYGVSTNVSSYQMYQNNVVTSLSYREIFLR